MMKIHKLGEGLKFLYIKLTGTNRSFVISFQDLNGRLWVTLAAPCVPDWMFSETRKWNIRHPLPGPPQVVSGGFGVFKSFQKAPVGGPPGCFPMMLLFEFNQSPKQS